MQITTPSWSNPCNPNSMPLDHQKTTKRAGITVCQAHVRFRNGPTQKPELKPIADYGVRPLARRALQAGTGLVRSAADFAFGQVMNSPYIGAVAPGLKETLLGLAVLYNEQQPTQAACQSDEFLCNRLLFSNNATCIDTSEVCNGYPQCNDPQDEGPDVCKQEKCNELGREFLCNRSLISNNVTCIDTTGVCDGFLECNDPQDEGPDVCTQEKCNELGREFLCNRSLLLFPNNDVTCIDTTGVCDGSLQCNDPQDEGPDVCTQEKCNELGREFLCNRSLFSNNVTCIDTTGVCDGSLQCNDPRDEGPDVCTQEKCNELGREFLCNKTIHDYPDYSFRGISCTPSDQVCDGHRHCDDPPDEGPELCPPHPIRPMPGSLHRLF